MLIIDEKCRIMPAFKQIISRCSQRNSEGCKRQEKSRWIGQYNIYKCLQMEVMQQNVQKHRTQVIPCLKILLPKATCKETYKRHCARESKNKKWLNRRRGDVRPRITVSTPVPAPQISIPAPLLYRQIYIQLRLTLVSVSQAQNLGYGIDETVCT